MTSLTIMFIFVPVLTGILLMLNVLLAVHKPDTEKVSAYECGFSPVYGQTRAPFSIQYYLVGILFLLFDLEILLLYPLATSLYQVGSYGFVIAVAFFLVLTLGFMFEWGKGALYFTNNSSQIRPTNTQTPSKPLGKLGQSRGYSTSAAKPKKSKKPTSTSTCLSLVPHGIMGSSVGFGRLTQYMVASTVFTKEVISKLVGNLLGDGSLAMTHTSVNPLFIFTQALKGFEYVWYIFNSLAPYCIVYPRLEFNKRKGKTHATLRVHTRSYPQLHTLLDLFYVKVNGKLVKTIDYTLLPYLDEIVLAHWAMDDGTKSYNGFRLYTNSFSFEEAYKLVAMLHYRFGLNCTVQRANNQPVISVRTASMPLFRSLVQPHFVPSMMYKLA